MLKYLVSLLFVAAAVAQPGGIRVPGPVIISQPGTGGGTGTVDTNEVIALIQQYGTGGGIVSNALVAFDLNYDSTHGKYTNATDYFLEVNATVALTSTNVVTACVTNSNDTKFQNYPFYIYGPPSANVTSNTIVFTVPPRGWYWVKTNFYTASTAVGREQQLFYYATNGGSGGSGTSWTAAQIGAIPSTNAVGIYQGVHATNLFLDSFYRYEIYGENSTNSLAGDGYGAWTYNRFNPGGSLTPRFPQSLDLQFVRYNDDETATHGNAILWGVGNVAGDGLIVQDNAVVVNGTQNRNYGIESTLVSGTHNTITNGAGAPAFAVILNGMHNLMTGDYSTILMGSNVVSAGYGSILGGYSIGRTNGWEFYYGYRTNGLSIWPTNKTITAEGDMRFVAGGSTMARGGFTNDFGDGNIISLGATNSASGAPLVRMASAGGTYDMEIGTEYLKYFFLGTPLINIDGTSGNIAAESVSAGTLTATTSATIRDATLLGTTLAQNVAQPTNTWAINTAFGLGTNSYYTGGAQTLGVTGVANNPAADIYYGELEFKPTGDIIFTNPVSFRTSDYAITRTFTNGNSVIVAVRVKPGVSTNLSFVQFR